MLVTFGPRGQHPDLEGDPAGTALAATNSLDYYREHRAKSFAGTYSICCVAVPLCIFAASVGLVDWMLAGSRSTRDLLLNRDQIPELPIPAFCGTAQQHSPLQLGVLADTIHFSAAHVALLAVCVLAYAAGATCVRNVLTTHQVLPSAKLCWWVSLTAPIIFGVLIFGCLAFLLEPHVSTVSSKLFPVPTNLPPQCTVLVAVEKLKLLMDQQIRIGALLVSIGVTALILAAATTAFRFEKKDPNGIWSKGFVLRQKQNSMLTLFVIGSVLLVISNIALTSALDWLTGILDVVHAATVSPEKTAAPDQSARAVAAAFTAITTLRGSLANFISVISALVLVSIFAPALYGLSDEIIIAGKCHAHSDMLETSEAGARSERHHKILAGWETLQAWEKKHGLKLSFADLTGSFLAVLAPLLSSRLIDLAKIATGGGS